MVIGDVEGGILNRSTSEMKCREQQCLGIIRQLAAAPREQTRVCRMLDCNFGSRRAEWSGEARTCVMEGEISSSRLVDDEKHGRFRPLALGTYTILLAYGFAVHDRVCGCLEM
jgi:hypothetical protein